MKKNQLIILIPLLTPIILLIIGLYLQVENDMYPCPLCIFQRYIFIFTTLISFVIFFISEKFKNFFTLTGIFFSFIGVLLASYHLWTKSQPNLSCGLDPLETIVNQFFLADLFPLLFQASGLCSTNNDQVFFLSIPMWSLIWYVFFLLIFSLFFYLNKINDNRRIN
tara:strand:- start:1595 stop:2092 length:498 start_codon:yes stop_codon:yes gene_type:complete